MRHRRRGYKWNGLKEIVKLNFHEAKKSRRGIKLLNGLKKKDRVNREKKPTKKYNERMKNSNE